MGAKSKLLGLMRGGAVRSLLCLVASLGLAAGTNAADLDWPVKAPPPLPDLTWKGVTLIGAIDVAGQYEQNGAPYAGNVYTPAGLITPWNRSAQFLFAPNQSLQSYIGVKVEEDITSNLKFIARLETGFNPTTGEISDALKEMRNQNGIALNQQVANGDGGRAGQILNGEAFVGFDSKQFGIVHIGRNSVASLDMLSAYDPLASYGFSLFGYVGFLAGMGSAETGKIDESIKYMNSWGPIRTELFYGRPDTNAKDFYQGTIGFVRPEFSFDFLAGQAHDMVSATALAGPSFLGSPFLGARVFDSTIYGAFAKYTFNVGGLGPTSTPESKFTVSGGYSRLDLSNPADGGWAPGHETIGGYQIGPALSTNGSISFGVVNYGYTGGDRNIDISFLSGKYQYDSQMAFSLGYYRYDQNSFGLGVNNIAGIVAPSYSKTACNSSTFINCAGTMQSAGFRADYQWNKNLMFYAGLAWSKVSGGFAFSYLSTSTIDPTVGVRFTF